MAHFGAPTAKNKKHYLVEVRKNYPTSNVQRQMGGDNSTCVKMQTLMDIQLGNLLTKLAQTEAKVYLNSQQKQGVPYLNKFYVALAII